MKKRRSKAQITIAPDANSARRKIISSKTSKKNLEVSLTPAFSSSSSSSWKKL